MVMEIMAKSLAYVCEWLGTKPYPKVDKDSHRKILKELRQLIEKE